MHHYRPARILIERSVLESRIVSNVRSSLPEVPVRVVDRAEEWIEESRREKPTIAQAKKTLALTRHRGQFFKRCPAGTAKSGQGNVCCNYFVVNTSANCHMECSYCYLQGHLNAPYMFVYANHCDLIDELDRVLSQRPLESFRIGTGELADSLALDPITGYGRILVEYFARQSNAVLEFKTKSDCVQGLIDLDHKGRTVVSFSINPPFVQQREEHKTATIEQRLEAAQACVGAGYPVVFHFDPIIHYPNWEKDYRTLVEEVFERIPSRHVPWVSLGVLRMSPGLKEIMRERFPHSFLPLGELLPSPDGKLRYFKPIRIELLSRMRTWIESVAPRTRVYTCMENADVWGRVFQGPIPDQKQVGDSLLQILR